ncbi:MAG: adenylate/guanylate cyclase domain-containing protein [Acidimicrobiales bacterium]
MASPTRTRYATCGDVEIAYQVIGDGPIDLLLYTGGTTPIDCVDEEPSMARFQRRLAGVGRVIRFDRRGVGLSDRGSPSNPPTEEQWVEDAVAVLDAVGSPRSVVLAPFVASPIALLMAATHPDRVTSLILVNGSARAAWAPDYPDGMPESMIELGMRLGADPDAVEQGYDNLAIIAPSVADDPAFRAWFDRSGNLGATPAMARAMQRILYRTDVRQYLPSIRVPTLIIQRADNPYFGRGHGRYLADHIAGAKYVELPGGDLLYWVGDTTAMLDEIEEFVTGVRGGSGADRVLATVLFTDIVGSTDRAAQLGDGRWRDLLDRHDQSVRSQFDRFRGREVKMVGDGFVASFDSPGRAIECALAIRDVLRSFDIGVRAGIHTGEIEVRGDDVAGLAVHIGARVVALAGTGEVLVSSTVKDLVAGSSVRFEDRGEHELRGVPGTWRLFAVDS